LDETLVHTETWTKGKQYDNIILFHQPIRQPTYDEESEAASTEDNDIILGINIRPNIKILIDHLRSKNFNIGVFSAGKCNYVEAVLKAVHLDKQIDLVLARDFCISFDQFFIKDLDIFPLDWEVKLIDNCIYSFSKNLDRGLLMTSFYDSKTDNEVEYIIKAFN